MKGSLVCRWAPLVFFGTSWLWVVVAQPTEMIQNPFHCTVSANDKESCVEHKHCVWCQGEGLPGICVSEKQEKALIHKLPHVKCFTMSHTMGDETPETSPLFLRGGDLLLDTTNNDLIDDENRITPLDPKCLTAPHQGSLDDDPRQICDSTTDSGGEENCAWCDAAGVFGLCLSHGQAETASSYLDCDL